VAVDGEMVVFVEVKARHGSGFGTPRESVVARKQDRLARAGLVFLVRHGLLERRCRFDVVEVLDQDGKRAVRHIRDAFRPSRVYDKKVTR